MSMTPGPWVAQPPLSAADRAAASVRRGAANPFRRSPWAAEEEELCAEHNTGFVVLEAVPARHWLRTARRRTFVAGRAALARSAPATTNGR